MKNLPFLLPFGIIVAFMACLQSQTKKQNHESKGINVESLFIDSSIEVDSMNVPIHANQYYFPKECFPKRNIFFGDTNGNNRKRTTEIEYDEFVLRWYSRYLFAMKEPLLFNRASHKNIYRFTWLRTFHQPIVIRIENDNDDYFLYWKATNGTGGYELGDIITDKKKQITETEWKEFEKLIGSSNFWDTQIMNGDEELGLDGAEWIMEGSEGERYQVKTLWSPDSGYFRKACLYLLALTDLNIDTKDIY